MAQGRIVEVRIGGLSIKNPMRVAFSVDKNSQSSTNKASITVSNLSATTMSRIENSNGVVSLLAGYEDEAGAKLLFVGNVKRFERKYSPPNIDFTMESQDGERVLNSTFINISYGAGTPGIVVLQAIAGQLGTVARFPASIPTAIYQNGFAFAGLARDALNRATKKLEFNWTIQNGELLFFTDTSPSPIRAPLITKGSGLKGVPEKLEIDGTRKKPGWKITSVLNSDIIPSGLVSIQSQVANGLFKVETVKHEGDNYGSEWNTVAEVVQV
jgi:hypothetical protein